MINDLFSWRDTSSNATDDANSDFSAGKRFAVTVTANAKHNRIKQVYRDNSTKELRVYVTAPAENGQANAAVIALLSRELNIPKHKLSIRSGLTGRYKIIQIAS
ncbi:DUF167 domain-containing protein [Alphaproteobacteria bacterium]|jgi:uncharacterized protein|nr:DUF167 domain-containing protein [Alphaproteobacteria bacterium]